MTAQSNDTPVDLDLVPDNPYLLLTPGPLSTSKSVRAAMLRDWCTWDDEYNLDIVQEIRRRLVTIATDQPGYTAVLMQGSGTFGVEATLGSCIPDSGRLLVLANGAYGTRISQIAARIKLNHTVIDYGEVGIPDPAQVGAALEKDAGITHVAFVHCETTTGIENPIGDIARVVKKHGRTCIVDAMSSFGGIPIAVSALDIDFIISSANKCIQGVPGFSFVVCRKKLLKECSGIARSLSLDLYDQWEAMEKGRGKWRYTSPTHVVRAFMQALLELEAEGGVEKRAARYRENHRALVEGMEALGFRCLIPKEHRSPIITSFHDPAEDAYTFESFYRELKQRGFVIYPGKVTVADTFRIGNIGHVAPGDIRRLLQAIEGSMYWTA